MRRCGAWKATRECIASLAGHNGTRRFEHYIRNEIRVIDVCQDNGPELMLSNATPITSIYLLRVQSV